MIIIIIRTFILYFTVLLSLRIMGKGELSKMDPFQMVILFMISELASLPIAEPDVSLIHGACAIITLMFLQILLSLLSLKSSRCKKLFNGAPSLLIEQGKWNFSEMKRLRISIDDLSQQLRLKGYPSLADVNYAIMEINGDLSVIPRTAKQPLTPDQIQLDTEEGHLPVVLIADGILYRSNLRFAGLTELALKERLLAMGVPRLEQVHLAYTDEHQNLSFCPRSNQGRNPSPKGGDH